MSSAQSDLEKSSNPAYKQHIEGLQQTDTHATYYDPSDVNTLTDAHRTYLQKRYGTLELDPIPDFGDADPFNWSTAKVLLEN